ncbi:MAG: UDP-N-acetylmuramoyl-L-alanine--D-glutamate ligase [Acidobacteria bacterium]|nr:UDP-N-acetylmuramoyl-L-alanine--D-glutamate ligase [Acidobacteriota bacterium]
MESKTSYDGKTVLVVGAGRSGLAATRFLIGRGARVILTDSRKREALNGSIPTLPASGPGSGALQLELGGHRPESFKRCDFAVVSPGVPLSLEEFDLCRKAGIPILSEIELAFRHLRGRVIGITGSNGKTTTTVLTTELLAGAGLRAKSAGNIGIPLTSLVPDSAPDDIYTVELSSFQLEAIRDFRPWIGSILNITPDHMNRYRRYEEYIDAKKRIFMNQEAADYAVLNADDALTASFADGLRATPVLFSRLGEISRGAWVKNNRMVYRDAAGERELFPLECVRLKGSHNLENVLAACTMAILAGAPPESLPRTVAGFTGVEHRIEFVAEIDGVEYYNDSKATNIDAAVKSIESFPGNILLIAGGQDKGGDFSLLTDPVRQRVKHLVLIGESAGIIRDALGDAVETGSAETIEQAVAICGRLARPGDTVLLAPACASFDMFENYEHRGRAFKEAVRLQGRRRAAGLFPSGGRGAKKRGADRKRHGV